MKYTALIPFFFATVAMAQSQPRIAAGGVRNSASYAAPGLPNSAIAQGSIFSVFGDSLGPDTPELGFNFPLPTVTPTGNVSVSVTVNGATTRAIILYAGKTQINAVLPSSTPAGMGTLVVSVNGQASSGVPIQVVANSFAIYTVNSAGSGPGIVTYADYSLVTVDNSANPGETLILWGTGIGPVSGDEAGSALPGDQAGVPVEVYVGGKTAAVTYRGRSGCCSGLDQIGFVVPPSVQGCSVPIAVKIGNVVSNFASMSVAAGGRACTDSTTGLTSTDFTTVFGKPNATFGTVALSRIAGVTAGGTTTIDSGFASFGRVSFAPGTSFSPALFNSVSFGACTVSSFSSSVGQSGSSLAGITLTGLDAGPAINISGPAGNRTLTPGPTGPGIYANTGLGNGTPGNYFDPGQYTITGIGGADIGAFTAAATVPTALVWTNQNAIQSVNQSAGQLITWSGGDASGFVSIDGTSVSSTSTQAVGASFHCQASVSDGSLTIPPIVLLSLPSSSGTLSVGESATSTIFKASGLDLGLVTASSASFKTVPYQLQGQQSAPPVANAGPNQVIKVGQLVQLNGSASMDPGGNPLTYQFTLVTVPSGSTAVLNSPTAVNPAFTADRAGTYVVQLIVNNGKVNSTPVTMLITTNTPSAPTANAGPNQNVALNSTVAFNGNGTDPQGFPLTFKWSLTSKPVGSTAALSSATAANPTFVADKPGAYTAQLIVNNGFLDSAPSTVTITINGGAAPVANAGPSQSNVAAGATVTLDGSASTGSSSGPLTYTWSFVSRPGGSAATLTGANSARPSFVADVAGTYVVQLIVNDGTQNSAPATVTITVGSAAAPSISATGGTPQSAPVGTQFASPFSVTVKDATGKAVSGAVVTFTAPASGAGGTFAGGVNTAISNASGVATSAAFTANATPGAYVVTASAPGITASASFALSNTTGTPASIAASAGTPQTAAIGTAFTAPLVVVVKDAAGNPVSGATVIFTIPATGAGGSFSGANNTATTNAQGIATSPVLTANSTAGSYTITASVAGVATAATFSLTNSPAVSSTGITVGSVSVGQNLQTTVTITLPQPAGTGGVPVTITSSDPSKLLVAGRAADQGQGTLTAMVGGGVTTAMIYVQGLASSGTVTLTASALNLTGTGTVTLTPSGFVLAGPNANGAGFTGGIGTNTPLTITSARLDASMTFVEAQPLRAGFSATVPLTSSTPGIGTVSPASVSFTGGQSGTATAQFTGVAAGTTTLTAGVPTGFSAPSASLNMVVATIGSAGLTAASVTVGNNLEASARVNLTGAAPAGGLTITLTSNDASKVLLSTTASAAGSASITLPIPAGLMRTQDFYVQALAGSGSVTYSATAPGFGTATGTVTLTPSGIIISGPTEIGTTSFFTGTGSAASPISVYSVQVDPTGFLNPQSVRGGFSATVTVTSSSPSVGTISASPVTISGGSSSASTSFQPLVAGSTTLSVNVPSGFTAVPQQFTSVVANVRTAGLAITDQVTIGMNLESSGTLVLGQLAPAGGQSVTLTSGDPKLLLSASPNTAGSGTLSLTVPAGSNNVTYYLQALSSSGSATYTASAPGFASRTVTVTYAPSGLLIEGPLGPGIPTSTTVASAPSTLTVYTAVLDASGNLLATQPLAGGLTVTASLAGSVAAVGTLTPAQVTITGGNGSVTTAFAPKAVGTTVISLQTPAGYATPSAAYSMLNVTVR